jgi:hypothetical protein
MTILLMMVLMNLDELNVAIIGSIALQMKPWINPHMAINHLDLI